MAWGQNPWGNFIWGELVDVISRKVRILNIRTSEYIKQIIKKIGGFHG